VHGDFYDGQVLVVDGSVAGVVDVDGVGRGSPAADAGNLLAHLLVLRSLAAPAAGVHGWLARLVPELLARQEPQELRRQTAAVLLGLATWPYTQHEPGWEDRTRALLDLTDRVLAGGELL
jgi:aminoglycoside phosphotransferase (APT) family kinase protein